MDYYMIEDTTAFLSSYDRYMLVRSTNKKEALNKMWIALGYDNQKKDVEDGYKPHYKKEFMVTRLDIWFERERYNGDVVVIH